MKAAALSTVLLAADAYGLAVRDCRPVRRAWRLETDRGVFALKPTPPPSTASLLYQAEVHLLANGFNRFPRRVLTSAGEPDCMLPTGACFTLRPWLPGIPPRLDPEHPRDLARTARAVAEMHRASKGLFSNHGPESYGAWPALIKTRMREIEMFSSQTGRDGRFARLYPRAIPCALAEAETALSLSMEADYDVLVQEAAAVGGFCHGDLAPNNALIHGPNAYLLDMERMERNVFPHDLATLIRRAASAQDWLPELAKALLEGYQRVCPLLPRELRVMTAILHWPQPFWRLGRQYFVEKLDRSERFFLSRLWHWTSGTERRRSFLAYCGKKF